MSSNNKIENKFLSPLDTPSFQGFWKIEIILSRAEGCLREIANTLYSCRTSKVQALEHLEVLKVQTSILRSHKCGKTFMRRHQKLRLLLLLTDLHQLLSETYEAIRLMREAHSNCTKKNGLLTAYEKEINR